MLAARSFCWSWPCPRRPFPVLFVTVSQRQLRPTVMKNCRWLIMVDDRWWVVNEDDGRWMNHDGRRGLKKNGRVSVIATAYYQGKIRHGTHALLVHALTTTVDLILSMISTQTQLINRLITITKPSVRKNPHLAIYEVDTLFQST